MPFKFCVNLWTWELQLLTNVFDNCWGSHGELLNSKICEDKPKIIKQVHKIRFCILRKLANKSKWVEPNSAWSFFFVLFGRTQRIGAKINGQKRKHFHSSATIGPRIVPADHSSRAWAKPNISNRKKKKKITHFTAFCFLKDQQWHRFTQVWGFLLTQ